ncbi:MAG: peptidoglycan DD-metalloendopeptidase family protein [Pseudomonadota bacterium]
MRALACLLICLGVATALAAPDNGKREELDELRQRIKSLQEELEQASEDRSEVADELKQSERRISDVNRGLRRLDNRQRELSRDLRQLNEDTRGTQREIADQQRRLAALIKERYIQGDGDALKLLLSGRDPGEVARNLAYYGYIGRARAELIRQHRESLGKLRTLQDKARKQNDDLTQVRQERVAQKQALEAEKGSRQEVLYKLSEQIRQQRREIDTLVRDEKRLTRLVERLARLAASKPAPTAKPGQKVDRVADASLAGLDFTRLKGRLALPVAGEILHKFGNSRDGGGPAWKGVFIRARQGQEVRAVGSGEVAFADWLRGFGNLLIIDHGKGYLSLYSNNESLYKQPGEPVRAGDVVAAVGATGGQDEPGLYFELRHQGKPFDPLAWVR